MVEPVTTVAVTVPDVAVAATEMSGRLPEFCLNVMLVVVPASEQKLAPPTMDIVTPAIVAIA
jgi:hypothetical protein